MLYYPYRFSYSSMKSLPVAFLLRKLISGEAAGWKWIKNQKGKSVGCHRWQNKGLMNGRAEDFPLKSRIDHAMHM